MTLFLRWINSQQTVMSDQKVPRIKRNSDVIVDHGCTKFTIMYEPNHNSGHQNDAMNQVFTYNLQTLDASTRVQGRDWKLSYLQDFRGFDSWQGKKCSFPVAFISLCGRHNSYAVRNLCFLSKGKLVGKGMWPVTV